MTGQFVFSQFGSPLFTVDGACRTNNQSFSAFNKASQYQANAENKCKYKKKNCFWYRVYFADDVDRQQTSVQTWSVQVRLNIKNFN